MCREGKKLLVDFAKKHDIPHDICGKVIVATSEKQLPHLDKIYENGVANQCEGIRYISSDEIKEYEPFCEGVKGIHVPTTGIMNYKAFTEKLVELTSEINPENKLFLGSKVTDISAVNETKTQILTSEGTFFCTKLISCAGLFADKISEKDNLKIDLKIVPFRGDYYELTKKGKHKVKHLIYPVPDPSFPFLGVHFTRMTDGEIECGPNAVFSFKREGYTKWGFSLRDSFDALTYVGTLKLFSRHWKQGLEEYKRAFSKKKFLKSLQQLIPSLEIGDIKVARSGVRAQALDSGGNLVYDFKIEKKGNHLHVLNAPSPAATACLSIADHVIGELKDN